MAFVITPQVLPFIGAVFVLTALLPVGWTNRGDPIALWFTATVGAMTIWAVGYIFEIMAPALEDKILFANIQFIGVGTVWLCWWETVRRYLGIRPLPRLVNHVLWLVPVVTLGMAFFNPAHLFRGSPFVKIGAAPFPVLHADYGPWYTYVLIPVVLLVSGGTLFVLARAIATAPKPYRRQYVLMFLSLALPLTACLVYVLDLGPWKDYNLTVAVTGLSGIMLAVGLFRWRLFNIVSLARDLVVENLTDGVIVADDRGRIADLNGAAEELLGLSRRTAAGRPAREVMAAHPALARLLDAGVPQDESGAGHLDLTLRGDADSHYYSLTVSPVARRRGESAGRAVVLHDVTERVRLVERTRELANTDDLTGLANRRYFLEQAALELELTRRYGSKTSLILVDVDHFKLVNDTYGHQAGDRVLKEVAAACRRALRLVDVIGRFGGEEFAVLLPHTGIEEAEVVAERLRAGVASLRMASGGSGIPITVTLSIGVTEFGLDVEEGLDTLESIIARADQAMYAAKRRGRDTVVRAEAYSNWMVGSS